MRKPSANERYLAHEAVCTTCKGEGLCDVGRGLLTASRAEEGRPRPARPSGVPRDVEELDDEEEEDHSECLHARGVLSSAHLNRGTPRAMVRVEVETFIVHAVTDEERATLREDTRAIIRDLARMHGVPLAEDAPRA